MTGAKEVTSSHCQMSSQLCCSELRKGILNKSEPIWPNPFAKEFKTMRSLLVPVLLVVTCHFTSKTAAQSTNMYSSQRISCAAPSCAPVLQLQRWQGHSLKGAAPP